MQKCKVIAVANQKGGVGKTTTTLNLGLGLLRAGKKVLLIDFDPQGDLTTSLGFRNQDELEITIKNLLEKCLKNVSIDKQEGVLKSKEGIDIIPANIELEALEISLSKFINREKVLSKYIEQIKKEYDYILIDCRPSLGLLTINALATADSVIIPVQAHYLPLKGMTQLIETIDKTRTYINPHLRIEGVLLTLADMQTNIAKTVEEALRENYGRKIKVYDTVIPAGVKAAESTIAGKSIYAYAKASKPAIAYENFTKEVLRDGKNARDRLAERR